MYAEKRKMHLIEEVLKVNNNDTLTALETVLKKSKTSKEKKLSIYDFVGILTKKETSDIRKAIKESAETINADDWK
jgi:UDP-glucose 6-dehydrogenase